MQSNYHGRLFWLWSFKSTLRTKITNWAKVKPRNRLRLWQRQGIKQIRLKISNASPLGRKGPVKYSWPRSTGKQMKELPVNIILHLHHWRQMLPLCCQGRWEGRGELPGFSSLILMLAPHFPGRRGREQVLGKPLKPLVSWVCLSCRWASLRGGPTWGPPLISLGHQMKGLWDVSWPPRDKREIPNMGTDTTRFSTGAMSHLMPTIAWLL